MHSFPVTHIRVKKEGEQNKGKSPSEGVLTIPRAPKNFPTSQLDHTNIQ